MFDGLVTELSATLSVASLLFFVAIYVVVSFRVFRQGGDELDERARLVLDPPLQRRSLDGSAGADVTATPVRGGHAAVRG